MSKTQPGAQTPIRTPRAGAGVPEHPQPKQGTVRPTIHLPAKKPK